MTNSNKGEVWCVYMRIDGGEELSEEEVIEFCRNRLNCNDFDVDIKSAFNVKMAISRSDNSWVSLRDSYER